ncbi:MAG: TVP38/TMEM64 family protein [Halanaerobium sp.]
MAKKKNKKKLIITIIIIAAAAYAVHHFGLAKYFSRQNLDLLQNWINDFGIMAPIIYIGLWIAACVFFLPGLPVAILGGLVFDPIPAVIYASLGSTTGATAAFLIGRYAARDLVEGWKKNNKHVQKIDEGVKKNGWRMLLLTRSVPVFPFNLQNYVYGLTDISLSMYFFVSWVTMIPGTVAYVLMASALASGESPMQILMYIAIAGVLIVLLSLIPKFIQNSDMVDDVEVDEG